MGMFKKLAVGVFAVATASGAYADIVELQDLNSYFRINTDGAGNGDAARRGADRWVVDGVHHLYQQWFWFRIGSGGPEMGLEDLNLLGASSLNTNPLFDANDDQATITFGNGLNVAGSTFVVQVKYSLSGGSAGSQLSDVAEQITVFNQGASAIDLHFFQYSDFDLNGMIGGQTATLVNANTWRQTGGGVVLNETVVTPVANHYEANTFANTRSALDNGVADDLNDEETATGDATWAFQWDTVVAAGGSFLISKDKSLQLIPAPGAALLAALGLGAIGRFRRRNA